MSGAPRAFYAPQSFFIISLDAVKALDGNWPAAACWQRIAWRSERDGYWRASMEDIAEEVGVSLRTAKKITKMLRDRGWVTAERDTTWDATLTWRPLFEGETAGHEGEGKDDTVESADVALSGVPDPALTVSADVALTQGADVALSSSQTGKTPETTSTPAAAAAGETPGRDLNAGREDVDRLCQHLHERLTERGIRHNHTTKAWRDAARLLMDVNGHPEDKIHVAIDWSANHEFWRTVIHSMPNLRDKYDRMREQAQQQQRHGRPVTNRHHEGGQQSRDLADAFH